MAIIDFVQLWAYVTCMLMIICYQLLKELNSEDSEHYRWLIWSDKQFNEVLHALAGDGIGRATSDKWMIMPDMSFLIAQRYKHVVVLMSIDKRQSKIFFPLRGASSHRDRMMCLAHVNDKIILWWYIWWMVVHFLPLPCYGDNTVAKMQSHEMKDILVGWLSLMN